MHPADDFLQMDHGIWVLGSFIDTNGKESVRKEICGLSYVSWLSAAATVRGNEIHEFLIPFGEYRYISVFLCYSCTYECTEVILLDAGGQED